MLLRGWVQYCFNTKSDSRLIFACENQRHLTAVRTPLLKVLGRGLGRTLFSKGFPQRIPRVSVSYFFNQLII